MRTRLPALVGLRLAVLLAAAVVLAHLRLDGRPSTLCLLRATTGVPCPLCGGTTAASRLGRGDLLGALAASPLAVAAAPLLAAAPVLRGRLRVPAWGVAVVLLGSEIWQLHRFGLL